MATFYIYLFIYFLYMFRVSMRPSSGKKTTVSTRHWHLSPWKEVVLKFQRLLSHKIQDDAYGNTLYFMW